MKLLRYGSTALLGLLIVAGEARGLTAANAEAEQARESYYRIAVQIAAIAGHMGFSDAQVEASDIAENWALVESDDLQELKDLGGEGDWLDLLGQAEGALDAILATIEEGGPSSRGESPPSDETWPDKECSLGNEWAASWQLAMGLVGATNSLEMASVPLSWACDKIQIAGIDIVKPFGFGDAGDREREKTCGADMADGKVSVPLHRFSGHGIRVEGGAGGSLVKLTPGLKRSCEYLERTVHFLERIKDYADTFGGCWTQGTAIANNGRLTEIRAQVEVVQGKLDVLTRLVVEGNLAVRGGLRLGSLYLPEDEDGALEIVRGYTQEAIGKTEEAGYKMKPEIQRLWDQAEAFREAGDYKRAYDRYRAAYSRATVKSFKLVASP